MTAVPRLKYMSALQNKKKKLSLRPGYHGDEGNPHHQRVLDAIGHEKRRKYATTENGKPQLKEKGKNPAQRVLERSTLLLP